MLRRRRGERSGREGTGSECGRLRAERESPEHSSERHLAALGALFTRSRRKVDEQESDVRLPNLARESSLVGSALVTLTRTLALLRLAGLSRWAPRDPSRTTKRRRPETTTPSLPTANRPSTRVVSLLATRARQTRKLTRAVTPRAQFPESLINHLSSQSLPSSSVPASRQQALDAHIQQRIAAELQQLRQQEHQVRQEIERALERENLDRERGASASSAPGQEEGKTAPLSHSASLLKDLEQLEKRASGLKKERAETAEWKAVDVGKEALERCFRCVPTFLGFLSGVLQ